MLLKYFKITDSPEKLKAKYHELALANHPDRGGSTDKMQEIVREYDYITKKRFDKRYYEFDESISEFFHNVSRIDNEGVAFARSIQYGLHLREKLLKTLKDFFIKIIKLKI